MLPYVGVTGFTERAQVEEAIDALPSMRKMGCRRLMVGVLASSKTLRGEGNRYPRRYPRVTDIADIFCDDPRCINLVHFSSGTPDWLLEELECLHGLVWARCHGYQLNIAWPRLLDMEEFRERQPLHSEFVLQLGRRAMDAHPHPVEAALRYSDTAGAVLVDPSGGRGIEFDAFTAAGYVRDLSRGPWCVGVAGGLTPENMADKLRPLLAIQPRLCFDAEGGLRNADDTLNMGRVISYIRTGFAITSGGDQG